MHDLYKEKHIKMAKIWASNTSNSHYIFRFSNHKRNFRQYTLELLFMYSIPKWEETHWHQIPKSTIKYQRKHKKYLLLPISFDLGRIYIITFVTFNFQGFFFSLFSNWNSLAGEKNLKVLKYTKTQQIPH